MLKRILIGFAGFVFLGVVLAAFFLFYDTPAPDTGSFVFSKTPDNEAYAARIKVLNECFPKQAFEAFCNKHPSGRDLYTCAAEDWNHAAVAGLLAQAGQNGLWQALDDVLQASPPPPINDDHTLEVLPRINLARLLEIKARDEVLRGHPGEALRTAFKSMALGRKWAGAGGNINSWLGSLAVRATALRTVAGTIAARPLPDEALREALARVPASRPDARETAWVIRGETAWALDLWSAAETGLRANWFTSFTYKPNLSKRRYLDRMTRMLSLAGCDEAALNASGIDQGIEDERPTKWTKHNPYNQAGRLVLKMMQLSVASCFKRDMELHSMTSAIEALLAIQLYGSAHDRRPPPSLEALVPDFLPEVPRDGFDGSAIRYSVEERVVWFPGRFKATPPFVRGEDEKGDWNWAEYDNVFFLDPPPPAPAPSFSSAKTSTVPP